MIFILDKRLWSWIRSSADNGNFESRRQRKTAWSLLNCSYLQADSAQAILI